MKDRRTGIGSLGAIALATLLTFALGCEDSAGESTTASATQAGTTQSAAPESGALEIRSGSSNPSQPVSASMRADDAAAIALASTGSTSTQDPPKPRNPDPSQAGQKYAVLVGVNSYSFITPLQRSVKDAHDLGKVLESIGFNVLLVTDDSERKPVKPSDLRNALLAFTRLTKPGDTIMFYFSGHGLGYRTANGIHDYVCPQIGTSSNPDSLLALREVCQMLAACQASHRILMVDACRSTPLGLNNGLREYAGTKDERFAALYSTAPGNVALETGRQRDLDGVTINNGIFTHFVLKGLTGLAEVDGDGQLSFLELGNYVAREMLDLSFANPDVYQIPYWNRGLASNRIFLRDVQATGGGGPVPGSFEGIVQIALRQPPAKIERYLMDELFANDGFRNDPEARKKAFAAMGREIGDQLKRDRFQTREQVERFIALLTTVLKLDGAPEVSLPYLNVGVEARDLARRVQVLSVIPTLRDVGRHPEVTRFFSRALPPLCRTAIDYQNLDALKSIFKRGAFPSTASCEAEVQAGIIRMETLDRPRWADQVYATMRPYFARLAPPARHIWAQFDKSMSSQDFLSMYFHVKKILDASEDKEQVQSKTRESVTKWLRDKVAATPLLVNTARAKDLANKVQAIAALGDMVPELREEVREIVGETLVTRAGKVSSIALLKDVLRWRTVAVAGGVPAKSADTVLSGQKTKFQQILVDGLPKPGDPATPSVAGGEILEWLAAQDPSFAKELGQRFRERGRQVLAESPQAEDRYLGEFALAIQLGAKPADVFEEIFPAATRAVVPSDAQQLRERARVLGSAHAKLGLIDGMTDVARACASASLDANATDVVATLVKCSSFVTPVRAVVAERLSASFAELAAGPGITQRFAAAAARAKTIDAQFAATGKSIMGDVRGVKSGLLAIFQQTKLEDVTGAEKLLDELASPLALSSQETAACRAKLVTDTADGDASLAARVEKYLAARAAGDFPTGPAPRVFDYYHAKREWEKAAEWIDAGGTRIDSDKAQSVRRVFAFRDRVRSWVGKRIPVIKKINDGRRPYVFGKRFEIVIEMIDGYEFRAETIGAARLNATEQFFKGSIVDGSLVFEPSQRPEGQTGFGYQKTFPQTFRLEETGVYGGIPLFEGRYADDQEGSVQVALLEPLENRVLLDSMSFNPKSKHRTAPGVKWLKHRGGSEELFFPVFVRDRANTTWNVGLLFGEKAGRIEGTLSIPDAANLKRWQRSQKNAARKCRVQFFAGDSNTPLAEIALPSSGVPTPFSVEVPRGTEQLRMVNLGKTPSPYLACMEMIVVR